jgi:hypothetical protein
MIPVVVPTNAGRGLFSVAGPARFAIVFANARDRNEQPAMSGVIDPQYYIEDGVHRAVALRENGVWMVNAILYEPGQAPRQVFVRLDQLHSPRASVNATPGPRHDLPAMIAWLATPAGRARMPPIAIQPLGEGGQTASVPLSQVQITA